MVREDTCAYVIQRIGPGRCQKETYFHEVRVLATGALKSLAAAFVFGVSVVPLRAQQRFVIRDVRVFDGERTLEHRSVLVDAGRIVRIGAAQMDAPRAVETEGRNRTLLPGLIDSHVHVADSVESALRQALAFGVTTVLDMFSGGERFERMKRIRSADPPDMADVRSAGVGATAPGGHPTEMGVPPSPP